MSQFFILLGVDLFAVQRFTPAIFPYSLKIPEWHFEILRKYVRINFYSCVNGFFFSEIVPVRWDGTREARWKSHPIYSYKVILRNHLAFFFEKRYRGFRLLHVMILRQIMISIIIEYAYQIYTQRKSDFPLTSIADTI